MGSEAYFDLFWRLWSTWCTYEIQNMLILRKGDDCVTFPHSGVCRLKKFVKKLEKCYFWSFFLYFLAFSATSGPKNTMETIKFSLEMLFLWNFIRSEVYFGLFWRLWSTWCTYEIQNIRNFNVPHFDLSRFNKFVKKLQKCSFQAFSDVSGTQRTRKCQGNHRILAINLIFAKFWSIFWLIFTILINMTYLRYVESTYLVKRRRLGCIYRFLWGIHCKRLMK